MKTTSAALLSFLFLCIFTCICQAWTFQTADQTASRNQKPEAVLCGVSPNTAAGSEYKYEVSLSQLNAIDSFCVQFEAATLPRITRFDMTTIPVKGYMEQVNCYNNRFDEVVKKLMNKLGPGDVIIFDGIKALDSNGKEIKLSPISLRII